MPSQPADPTPSEFWTLGAAELLAALKTAPAGLSSDEAARRLLSGGRNVLAETAHRRILAKIGKRLADPLIAILIVAALIAGGMGDLASAAIILVVVAASIALEVTQEHSAQKAVDALKHSVAVRAAVRRDGKVVETPVEEIVPGDVIELAARRPRAGRRPRARGGRRTGRRIAAHRRGLPGRQAPGRLRRDGAGRGLQRACSAARLWCAARR